MAEQVAQKQAETLARQAATGLYNAAAAVLLAWESVQPGGDPRRALIARFVMAHRLSARDPLAPEEQAWEATAADLILNDRAVDRSEIMRLLG
jgi:hypothetical protein